MKTYIVIIATILIGSALFASSYNERRAIALSGDTKALGGVINKSAKVIVQSGAYIIISGAGNYISEGSGSLPGAGSISLTGDFINNNSFSNPISPTVTIRFDGQSRQSISGNQFSLGNVVINNPTELSLDCNLIISGTLTVAETAGVIIMTDSDLSVDGEVSGTPNVFISGTAVLGELGENANVSIESTSPMGLPSLMNNLVVNPGEASEYILPNSTSVSNINFTSGALIIGEHALLIRTKDLILSGDNAITSISVLLSPNPVVFGEHASIAKKWNMNGQSDGDIFVTLRWTDAENNGNDFSSGFANVSTFTGGGWTLLGRYPIVRDGDFNTLTISRSFGAKADNGDYTITGDDHTLPVTLSSFTALTSGQTNVRLTWITQSESSLIGYNILRGNTNLLQQALTVSDLIEATNTSSTKIYNYDDSELDSAGEYYYWLMISELNGEIYYHGPLAVKVSNPTNPDGVPSAPSETCLLPAYPNPFNPKTTIKFALTKSDHVQINIFNVRGTKVWCKEYDYLNPGMFSLDWNGKDNNDRPVASGMYFYQMKTSNYSNIKKMLLLK